MGGETAANDTTERLNMQIASLRGAVSDIDHPPTELVLTRRCLDAAKVNYQLRCNGDRMATASLRVLRGRPGQAPATRATAAAGPTSPRVLA